MRIRNSNQEYAAVKNTSECLKRCYNTPCSALPSYLEVVKMGKYPCFHFSQREFNNTSASAMLITTKLRMRADTPEPKLAFSSVS